MAYLDNYLRQRNEQLRKRHQPKRTAIFNEGKRKHIVGELVHIITDFRRTPFENEADCRTGIRSSLCLQGYGWSDSDGEAHSLTEAAFKRIGAQRPSWPAGQPEYTQVDACCSWCGNTLGAHLFSSNRRSRFCSPGCAASSLAKNSRDPDHPRNNSVINNARYLVRKAKARPIACKGCQTPFQPRRDGDVTQYCSMECFSLNRRVVADRTCGHCGTVFRARAGNDPERGKFCSKKCTYAHGSTAAYTRQCTCCNVTFIAKKPEAIYCSSACKHTDFRRRKKAGKQVSNVIYLTAEHFDRTFDRGLNSPGLNKVINEKLIDRLFG